VWPFYNPATFEVIEVKQTESNCLCCFGLECSGRKVEVGETKDANMSIQRLLGYISFECWILIA